MLLWRGDRVAVATARRRAVTAAVGVLLLLAGVAAIGVTARPAFTEDLRVTAGQHAELPEYGADGSVVVRYRHGATMTLRLRVANSGLLPLTVTSVDPFLTTLGLVSVRSVRVDGAPLPVRLGPRESADVVVEGVFDNCRYFTERAIDPSTHARVVWRLLGLERTSLVAYPDALLVRSPTIVDCPGRVLDRGAMQRNRDATITGRG